MKLLAIQEVKITFVNVIWFTESQHLDLLSYTLYSKLLRHVKKLTEANLTSVQEATTCNCRLGSLPFTADCQQEQENQTHCPSHSTSKNINANYPSPQSKPFIISSFLMLHFFISHNAEDSMQSKALPSLAKPSFSQGDTTVLPLRIYHFPTVSEEKNSTGDKVLGS